MENRGKIVTTSVPSGNDKLVIDASLSGVCWLLTFPWFHFGCCPFQTVLTFEGDEVERYDRAICGERTSIRKIGNMSRAEIGSCCCLVCVDSDLGTMIPRYGCDRDTSNYIVRAVNKRSIAWQERRAQVLHLVQRRTDGLDRKVEALQQHSAMNNTPSSLQIEER